MLQVLIENGVRYQLRIFDSPARQASQAADLLGCPLGAIVKSLVFQKQGSSELLLVLVSGKNRADIQKLNHIVGEDVQVAKPKTVLSLTGYPIGAVPPIGLKGVYPVIMDLDLLDYEQVWSSAGAENMLIQINRSILQNMTQAQVAQIKDKRG